MWLVEITVQSKKDKITKKPKVLNWNNVTRGRGGQVHLHISLYNWIHYRIYIPDPQNALFKTALMLSLTTTLKTSVQMNADHNNLTAQKEKHNLDSQNMDKISVVRYTQ